MLLQNASGESFITVAVGSHQKHRVDTVGLHSSFCLEFLIVFIRACRSAAVGYAFLHLCILYSQGKSPFLKLLHTWTSFVHLDTLSVFHQDLFYSQRCSCEDPADVDAFAITHTKKICLSASCLQRDAMEALRAQSNRQIRFQIWMIRASAAQHSFGIQLGCKLVRGRKIALQSLCCFSVSTLSK